MQAETSTQTFKISRAFDAPRALVYKAWTEAERLAQWWGPKGFTNEVKQLDLKPGGIFHYSMVLPDGAKMWGRFIFKEIVPPERLVFVVSFSDESAGIVRSPFCDIWPLETLSTVTLVEQDGQTIVTMEGTPINASEEECKTFTDSFASMTQGWTGTLDQLTDYLKKATA